MKITKKKQKPIEYDCHFKYRCPQAKCGYDHWISLNQAKTKNYKIVCDCGFVFQPKRIKTIKAIFFETETGSFDKKTTKSVTAEKQIQEPLTRSDPPEIPITILNKSTDILLSYGFLKEEAELLLKSAYTKSQISDCGKLIKFTLENMKG